MKKNLILKPTKKLGKWKFGHTFDMNYYQLQGWISKSKSSDRIILTREENEIMVSIIMFFFNEKKLIGIDFDANSFITIKLGELDLINNNYEVLKQGLSCFSDDWSIYTIGHFTIYSPKLGLIIIFPYLCDRKITIEEMEKAVISSFPKKVIITDGNVNNFDSSLLNY